MVQRVDAVETGAQFTPRDFNYCIRKSSVLEQAVHF